jgi:S1-C subfamily serine protease
LFVDPAAADFRLQVGSKAFDIGFENFPMDQFGVQKPALKKITAQPRIPELLFIADEKTTKEVTWLQSKVKSVNGLGERSAYGLPDENGVIVLELSPKSPLAKAGLQKGDVIRKANGEVVTHVEALQLIYEKVLWTGKMSVQVIRNQAELGLVVDLE